MLSFALGFVSKGPIFSYARFFFASPISDLSVIEPFQFQFDQGQRWPKSRQSDFGPFGIT